MARYRPSAAVKKTDADLAKDMAAFHHDPLGYVLYNYPWGHGPLKNHKGPRKWQRQFLQDLGNLLNARYPHPESSGVVRMSVASGHGIGKSALVAWLIQWTMDTQDDSRSVATANTETQLKTKTWPELAKWHGMSLTRHWTELKGESLQSTQEGHETLWRADAIPWSEKSPESFAGLHNEGKRILLIFDESSAISDKIWEVSEGAMTDEHTEIIWVVFSNPTRNTGRFRECFRKQRHRWNGRQIDSRDVEGTNKEQADALVADFGEDSDIVKVRVKGQFPSASVQQMIPTDTVDQAFGRELRDEQYKWAPVIIGVDPAWTGSDAITIYLRQGLYSRLLRRIPKSNNDMSIAGVVATYEDLYHADAVFIDFGYGTGIVSAGHTMGRQWVGVWMNEKSMDPGCVNKRAENWKNMLKWLDAGGTIPKDQRLYDDLIGPEIRPTPDGRLLLESKEDMKKRGLPSPNDADALSLTFSQNVVAKTSKERLLEELRTDVDVYDNDPYFDPLEVA